jgi:hypothetical protein
MIYYNVVDDIIGLLDINKSQVLLLVDGLSVHRVLGPNWILIGEV